MKTLAVARFTLLRLYRSNYVLAALLILGLVLFMLLISKSVADASDLNMTHNAARMILWLLAIWLGISVVQADRADGTLRSTLTRPVSLLEVMIGKLLGAFFFICLLAAALSAFITLGAYFKGTAVGWASVLYQVSLLPVYFIVLALAMALSQVTPRFVAGLAVLLAWDGLFKANVVAAILPRLPQGLADVFQALCRVAYYLAPPTSTFFITYRDFARGSWAVDSYTYFLLLPYALHYAFLACLLATWALSREEL